MTDRKSKSTFAPAPRSAPPGAPSAPAGSHGSARAPSAERLRSAPEPWRRAGARKTLKGVVAAARVGLGAWAIGGWRWGSTKRFSLVWTKGYRYEPIAVGASHHTCCE